MDRVILVDTLDREIGSMEKMEAHRKGLLHRAFSVFLYNAQGQLLLQQRADHKYHSGGLWTNACCSHPAPGEDVLAAAKRRLREEIGISGVELSLKTSFIYKAEFENGLTEHELDYVITGITEDQPVLNPDEAKAFRWVSPSTLLSDIKSDPSQYTFWLKEIVRRQLL